MTLHGHLFGGAWAAEDGIDDKEIQSVWKAVLDAAPPTIFLHASYEVMRRRRPLNDAASGIEDDNAARRDIAGRRAAAHAFVSKILLSFDTGMSDQQTVVNNITKTLTSCCAAMVPAGPA
jgi:hypothetical protein